MTDLSERHRLVSERLDRDGSRYTASRRGVVAALSAAAGPLTPADLHARVDGVPLSSLYRSIGVLAEAGVVTRSHDPNGIALVELDEWLAGHHHHLICTSCGEVRDIDTSEEVEGRLHGLAEEMADATGYRLLAHRMDIEGICGLCLS